MQILQELCQPLASGDPKESSFGSERFLASSDQEESDHDCDKSTRMPDQPDWLAKALELWLCRCALLLRDEVGAERRFLDGTRGKCHMLVRTRQRKALEEIGSVEDLPETRGRGRPPRAL